MFGKYGIDFGPEAHKGFSDREWKLACEFFDLMLHLPLTEDEDEWDSFFDWALSEVFDVDENTGHEVAFAEAEDALEWLRGLFEEDPEQNEIPFDPYLKIQRTSETPKRSSVYRDENGNLHCWNISAYQIPSISLTEEISGTVYTVTGRFEGSQNMLRKLERITAQNFSAEMGEDA